MKEFTVTALIDGKLETWVGYHRSVSTLRKYITNYWAANFITAKIVRIQPSGE